MQIKSAGTLPIVVGGTGLYLRALAGGFVSRAATFGRTAGTVAGARAAERGSYLHRFSAV